MQDLLSLRLSSLFQPGSTPEARTTLKCELLDLAKVCQVVPQNAFLLRTVANTLTPAVQLVFGAKTSSQSVSITTTPLRVSCLVVANPRDGFGRTAGGAAGLVAYFSTETALEDLTRPGPPTFVLWRWKPSP